MQQEFGPSIGVLIFAEDASARFIYHPIIDALAPTGSTYEFIQLDDSVAR